jgi:hypothetical protein
MVVGAHHRLVKHPDLARGNSLPELGLEGEALTHGLKVALFKSRYLIATCLLCPAHSQVGIAEQILGGHTWARKGNSGAEGNVKLERVDFETVVAVDPQVPLRPPDGIGGGNDALEDHSEDVSSHPGDRSLGRGHS